MKATRSPWAVILLTGAAMLTTVDAAQAYRPGSSGEPSIPDRSAESAALDAERDAKLAEIGWMIGRWTVTARPADKPDSSYKGWSLNRWDFAKGYVRREGAPQGWPNQGADYLTYDPVEDRWQSIEIGRMAGVPVLKTSTDDWSDGRLTLESAPFSSRGEIRQERFTYVKGDADSWQLLIEEKQGAAPWALTMTVEYARQKGQSPHSAGTGWTGRHCGYQAG